MNYLNTADRFVVVTGGPGSGKTALLGRLQEAGFATTGEAGRGVIQEQVVIGGQALPWADRTLFAELMLSWEMRSYRAAQRHEDVVVFDRGVPDVVGYLRLCKLAVPAHVSAAAETYCYNRRVFIAPPWPKIFEQDDERKQDLEEAEQTYRAMVNIYTRLGYELLTLPKVDIEGRAQFVKENIAT